MVIKMAFKKYWHLIIITVTLVAVQAIISLYLPDLMSKIVSTKVSHEETWIIFGVLAVKCCLFR